MDNFKVEFEDKKFNINLVISDSWPMCKLLLKAFKDLAEDDYANHRHKQMAIDMYEELSFQVYDKLS